jgi:AraC-like DNA-binding protein
MSCQWFADFLVFNYLIGLGDVMAALPLVRAGALSPVFRLLKQIGAPLQPLMLQSKLPDSVLDEPEALISLYQAFSFFNLAARREGIAQLGLLASQQAQMADFGLLGKILSQSLTGYDLLHTLATLIPTIYSSGAQVWLTQSDDRVWINQKHTCPANQGSQQIYYYCCLLYLRIIQSNLGTEWVPMDLYFQAERLQELSEMNGLTATRVRFNQPNNAISFSKSLVHRPIRSQTNPSLNSQDMYKQLQETAPASDLVESMRQYIRFHLQSGSVHIEEVAAAAGISTRSLQRRLLETGLSYSSLVDQVRFELAVEWLKDPTVQLVDIAFELGYTTPANFTRAFQRWAGVSPSKFRRLQLLN